MYYSVITGIQQYSIVDPNLIIHPQSFTYSSRQSQALQFSTKCVAPHPIQLHCSIQGANMLDLLTSCDQT